MDPSAGEGDGQVKHFVIALGALCVAGCGGLDPKRLDTEVSVAQPRTGQSWAIHYDVAAASGAGGAGLSRGQVKALLATMLHQGLVRQRFGPIEAGSLSGAELHATMRELRYDRSTGTATAALEMKVDPGRNSPFSRTYRHTSESPAEPRAADNQYRAVSAALRSTVSQAMNDVELLQALDEHNQEPPECGADGKVVGSQQQCQQPLRECAPGETPRKEQYNQHVPGPPAWRWTCRGPGSS
jgi:hypothetical protein